MLVKQEKKQIPILMYHSIAQSTNPKFKQFAVPPALFAEHMTYLRQHSYTPINVTQLVCMLSQGKFALPERPVVLTFDDGFADFYTNALPVLQQCGFTKRDWCMRHRVRRAYSLASPTRYTSYSRSARRNCALQEALGRPLRSKGFEFCLPPRLS